MKAASAIIAAGRPEAPGRYGCHPVNAPAPALLAAEALVRSVPQRLASGVRISMEANCAKMFASEMVGRVAERAVQVHGGAGYMRDSVVQRFFRDVRVFRIYEGTTRIRQTIIGKELARRYAAGGMA